MKRNEIYIWGTGGYADRVYECIERKSCCIGGMIDSAKQKQGKLWNGKFEIFKPEALKQRDFDYILISTKTYSRDVYANCIELGIEKEKIISFWEDDLSPYNFLNKDKIQILVLQQKLELYQIRLGNAPYEYGKKPVPNIKSVYELFDRILSQRASLSRFGDGEFELIKLRERPWFQKVDQALSMRLEEILNSNESEVAIAIANDFGSLECYTEEIADDIRKYLANGVREEMEQIIDFDREYYDAYISRPYLIYKDKMEAKKKFELWKQLWKHKKILIVEGKYSRIGIGNDLFAEASVCKRIVCPEKNAYDMYDSIFAITDSIAKDFDIILISLGPTATVLAYDLGKKGHQAVDIGHLDNEYEWYLMGAENREELEGKAVAELPWCHRADRCDNKIYNEQIVKCIM